MKLLGTAIFAFTVAAAILLAGMLAADAAPRHHAVGRPSAWCGWFARFNFLGYDPGPEYNLAANWRRIGSQDYTPHTGDIVVWPHHVGKIAGQCNGYRCSVWSGNDGHAVRTRLRSVAGAVFRRV
jgi:hypothetical protein